MRRNANGGVRALVGPREPSGRARAFWPSTNRHRPRSARPKRPGPYARNAPSLSGQNDPAPTHSARRLGLLRRRRRAGRGFRGGNHDDGCSDGGRQRGCSRDTRRDDLGRLGRRLWCWWFGGDGNNHRSCCTASTSTSSRRPIASGLRFLTYCCHISRRLTRWGGRRSGDERRRC